MSNYNTMLRRFKQSNPAGYYEKQAQEREAAELTDKFLSSGGNIETVESFVDRQEKERKQRIRKWGKTLYDEPAPRKKTAPKKAQVETSDDQAEFVSVTVAAEMLGFSYSWLRHKIIAGGFKHLTVKQIGNAKHFVTAEIEALIPTHHRDNVPPPHNSVKLTIDDVLEFRRQLATNKHTVGELCGRFKISVSTGYRIASGEQYRNIKLND